MASRMKLCEVVPAASAALAMRALSASGRRMVVVLMRGSRRWGRGKCSTDVVQVAGSRGRSGQLTGEGGLKEGLAEGGDIGGLDPVGLSSAFSIDCNLLSFENNLFPNLGGRHRNRYAVQSSLVQFRLRHSGYIGFERD